MTRHDRNRTIAMALFLGGLALLAWLMSGCSLLQGGGQINLPPQAPPLVDMGCYVTEPSGQGVEGVLCESNGQHGVTNASGNAYVGRMPVGTQIMLASKDGYERGQSEYDVIPPPHANPHNVPITLVRLRPIFSRGQKVDFQGDLMLWVPELKPQCPEDPETRLRCIADNGQRARGIEAGWVWTLTAPWFPPAKRQRLYQAAVGSGYTHFPVQVTRCKVESGYHGTTPRASCDGFGELLNTVLREVHAAGLVTVCSGATPEDPVEPGLDRSLCDVVFDDWDNTAQKDCHIDYLGREFHDALVYVEMPAGVRQADGQWTNTRPAADACSPQPFPSAGGEWIHAAQRRVPNFVGVLYEINYPEGLDRNVAYANQAHVFFHDAQEVLFETDTYWKYWDNVSPATATAHNDALRQRLPWLRGFMSGGTAHAPPSADEDGEAPAAGDAFDFSIVRIWDSPTDIPSWARTATITRVDLSHDIIVDFDKRTGSDRWPDVTTPGWTGPLQYTLGMCLNRGGWQCSAPIQFWYGRDLSAGGNAHNVAAEWFYAERWGPLRGQQPQVGEEVALFIIAGDGRGQRAPTGLRERSNVVLVRWP